VLHRLTLGLGLQDPSEDDVYFIMNELDVNGDRKLSRSERSEFTNLHFEAFNSVNTVF
jgi:hypothetical protein